MDSFVDGASRDSRHGTVYLTMLDSGTWGGYWENSEPGTASPAQPGMLEKVPEGLSIDACLAWASARARRVVVDDRGRVFWAGEDPPPPDVPDLFGS
jgi:hypothetical protein